MFRSMWLVQQAGHGTNVVGGANDKTLHLEWSSNPWWCYYTVNSLAISLSEFPCRLANHIYVCGVSPGEVSASQYIKRAIKRIEAETTKEKNGRYSAQTHTHMYTHMHAHIYRHMQTCTCINQGTQNSKGTPGLCTGGKQAQPTAFGGNTSDSFAPNKSPVVT